MEYNSFLRWSQIWNPDLERPNIRRVLIVEEPIILSRDQKRRLASFPKRSPTRKIQTSLKVQVQQCIKFTVSWLELDRKNGSLTQMHPLIWPESSHCSRATKKLQRLPWPLQMEIFYLQKELEISPSRPNMVTSPLQGELDRNLISVPQPTSMRMLKDKCVISGKQGHVMNDCKEVWFLLPD